MKERIELLIKHLGIIKKEFASTIEVSTGNLSDWLSGKAKPTTDALTRIAERYNVNINWLLTGEGEMFRTDNAKLPSTIRSRNRVTTRVPLVNYVPAGYGQIDDIPCEDYFDLPVDEDGLIALRVAGDSMEPEFYHGDIVFVRRIPLIRIKNGHIYALIYDNETSLKRVFKEKEGLLLVPSNPQYKPLLTKEVKDVFELRYFFREVARNIQVYSGKSVKRRPD